MKARQMIEGAGTFGPEQIQIMAQALEGAWAHIQADMSDRKEIEHVRLKPAQTILVIAGEGVGTAKEIKDEAIKRMSSIK